MTTVPLGSTYNIPALIYSMQFMASDNGEKRCWLAASPFEIRFLDEFLADPTHRAKCGRNKCYGLRATKQGKELGVKQYNCEKISRLMGYFLYGCRNLQFDQFKEKSDCSLNHPFGV
jgi:hypothetical protein